MIEDPETPETNEVLSSIPWDALHEIADILCITGQYDETVIVEEVKKLKATAQQAL